ncbi:hypothetical protein [Clostridium tyrobutyricum]|uniref:hypothetical protein n=1 Tax=Clostridium tyrobutyricum TaxID=1519 RepID=UPI001C37ED04|nr:hypothetical protein [Clostridium tyrobutyricum]MBV4423243.1 hypothetical protein [Clostridium tyrobutyricum]MEA5008228.1 hypothetical protein [Clostridium tyrobutyricum]
MYELWKERRISKPSEYWNYSSGDKLFTRAFWNEYVQERNRKMKDMDMNKTPIFPTISV